MVEVGDSEMRVFCVLIVSGDQLHCLTDEYLTSVVTRARGLPSITQHMSHVVISLSLFFYILNAKPSMQLPSKST